MDWARFSNPPVVPPSVRDAYTLLKTAGASAPEHFAGAVWFIEISGSVPDAMQTLGAGGWRKRRETRPTETTRHMATMSKRGVEAQIQAGLYGARTRVVVDTKP
jgi:hypothetical protein